MDPKNFALAYLCIVVCSTVYCVYSAVLTVTKCHGQSSSERSLNATEVLLSSHQVVAGAVKGAERRVSDVVAHAVDLQTVLSVQQLFGKLLVAVQRYAANAWICDVTGIIWRNAMKVILHC